MDDRSPNNPTRRDEHLSDRRNRPTSSLYHGCFCSPSISTFKKVLSLGTRLPGTTERDTNIYPPTTAATAAGHLDDTRWVRLKKALQEQQPELRVSEGEDINPLPVSPPRGQYIYVRELPLEPGLIHGDSTGPNPIVPKNEWDRLINIARITLNLMRPSVTNPLISAYEFLCGPSNWKKTPLGPPGAHVMILDRANERPTWNPHGELGFYIGPHLNHQKCFEVLVTKTNRTRISDSLSWFPTSLAPPIPTKEDILATTAEDLKETTKYLTNKKVDLYEWCHT